MTAAGLSPRHRGPSGASAVPPARLGGGGHRDARSAASPAEADRRRPAPAERATRATSVAALDPGLRRAGRRLSPAAQPAVAGRQMAAGERDGRPRLEIPPEAEFNGELLRQVRESYGLSLQQVSERTRITRMPSGERGGRPHDSASRRRSTSGESW